MKSVRMMQNGCATVEPLQFYRTTFGRGSVSASNTCPVVKATVGGTTAAPVYDPLRAIGGVIGGVGSVRGDRGDRGIGVGNDQGDGCGRAKAGATPHR